MPAVLPDAHGTVPPNVVPPQSPPSFPNAGDASWWQSHGIGGSGWNSLRDNPISNFIFGGQTPGQPNAGAPLNPADPNYYNDLKGLQRDPNTGLYFNPRTGTSYTDPNGQTPVTDPNVAQQVARNFSTSQSMLDQLPGLEKQRQQVFNAQTDAAQNFRDVISGKAPSVAGMQAQQGMNTIADSQQSQAAGVSGAASPLASLMAMRNTGSAQAGANNTAAMARAKEEEDARNALTNLLASQGQGVAAARSDDIGGAHAFADTSAKGQAGQQGLNYDASKTNVQDNNSFGSGVLKFISTI